MAGACDWLCGAVDDAGVLSIVSRRYRFHCTDGRDAVFDLGGRLVGRQRELRGHAEAAARALMRGCAGEVPWSGWTVEVYDAGGRRRIVVPFAEVRFEHR